VYLLNVLHLIGAIGHIVLKYKFIYVYATLIEFYLNIWFSSI